MTIDRDTVRKVAHLARLELSDSEEELFTGQLNNILGYVEELSALDTQGVEPTTRAIETTNVVREDELTPWQGLEEILQNAPDREDQFFKVPKIL
jgi:aspartyl-tRNA(Asn)/glutamyl-tRNA(Gln) amidotransferase subunit C